MEVQVHHPDFVVNSLVVRTAGMWTGPKLQAGGVLLKGKRGTYEVKDDSGRSRQLKVKSALFDPVPKVQIDDQLITLVRPLKWFEYAWMGFPIALVFVGGGLGALFGLGATYANARIFRSSRSRVRKYVISALISIAAVVGFFISAMIVHMLVYGVPQE